MSKKLRSKPSRKRFSKGVNMLISKKENYKKLRKIQLLMTDALSLTKSKFIDKGTNRVLNKSFSGLGSPLKGYVPISKIDEEKRMVYGIAVSDTLDKQEEIVEWEATKRAVPEYLKWRNLREMHKPSAVGTVPELELDDVKKQMRVGAHVVDNDAWKKVKEGVYKGFSIGGNAKNRIKEYVKKLGKVVSKVKDYALNEISLVDRPANPDTVFTMVKRDILMVDPLITDVDYIKNKATSLMKKVLSDSDIAKLPNSKFGLIKRKKMASGSVMEERFLAIPDKSHAMAVLRQLETMPLTKKEKFVVHNKAKTILGKAHKANDCPYCLMITGQKKWEGGDLLKMNKEKLAQARLLINDLLGEEAEEAEAMQPDADLQVEGHVLEEADKKEDFDPELEDFIGDEEEEEEGKEFEGEDLDDEDERTHLYDDLGEREEKATSPDPDDVLEEEDLEGDEDDEGCPPKLGRRRRRRVLEEEEGGSSSCPYCGTTLKALLAGKLQKGGVPVSSGDCPSCGTTWSLGQNRKVTISSSGGNISKRDLRMKKLDAAYSVIDQLITENQKLANVVTTMPKPRKFKVDRPGAEVSKADTGVGDEQLQKDVEKAKSLRKMVQDGKVLSAEEKVFCESTLNKMLDGKFSG